MKNCLLLNREEQRALLEGAGLKSRFFRTYSSANQPFWLDKLTLAQADEVLNRFGDTSCSRNIRDEETGEFMVSMSGPMTCKVVADLMNLPALAAGVADVVSVYGTHLLVILEGERTIDSLVGTK